MPTTTLTESVLERIVSRTQELYSLPNVVTRVMELTNQEPLDIRALKATIELDPALTSKILRVANCAYFGLRGEVTNLNQAITLLGCNLVKTLVLSFCLPESLVRDVDTQVLERYWRTTVYRAVAARRIAQSLWKTSGEEVFIAALLQDIGILALAKELGDTYTEFISHVSSEGADLIEQEMKVLEFSHAQLSAQMLASWGLPDSLVRIIGNLSTAEDSIPQEDQQPLQTLQLANLVAEFLISGQPSALLRTLDAASLIREQAREEMRNLLVELEAEMVAQTELFSLAPPANGEFARLMAAAYQRLTALSSGDGPLINEARQETHLPQVVDGLRQELRNITKAMRIKLPALKPPAETRIAVPLQKVAQEHPAFSSQVRAAVGRCRNQRCSLSLVLLTLDQLEASGTPLGSETLDRLVGWLRRVCVWETEREQCVIPVGDNCFALLLEDCDRSHAIGTSRRIMERTRKQFTTHADQLRLSAGVATLALPPRNFPERELIDAAVRCLQGAQSSGVDAAKSFEL